MKITKKRKDVWKAFRLSHPDFKFKRKKTDKDIEQTFTIIAQRFFDSNEKLVIK